MTDPENLEWLTRLLPPAAPPDVVPPRRTRPTREVVAALLGCEDGAQVTMTESVMTEDNDGLPLGVRTTTTHAAFVRPRLEDLGWTQVEWDDASVTE